MPFLRLQVTPVLQKIKGLSMNLWTSLLESRGLIRAPRNEARARVLAGVF